MSNHTTNQIERSIAKCNTFKDIGNIFRLKKKKHNVIKDEITRYVIWRTLFKSDEVDYCEPVRINSAFDDNCIEYESNGDKDKTLSIEEYLDQIRLYLSNTTNDHKTQGKRKIQLTIAINFLTSKDTGEMRTMHSKTDNIWILINC